MLKEHTGWIAAVAFSPDGKLLAIGQRRSDVKALGHGDRRVESDPQGPLGLCQCRGVLTRRQNAGDRQLRQNGEALGYGDIKGPPYTLRAIAARCRP